MIGVIRENWRVPFDAINAGFLSLFVVLATWVMFFPMGFFLLMMDDIGMIEINWPGLIRTIAVAATYMVVWEFFNRRRTLDAIFITVPISYGILWAFAMFVIVMVASVAIHLVSGLVLFVRWLF